MLFFLATYFLHRPCVYCSVLLVILFFTSCNWSDQCFFDASANWFFPRTAISHSNTPTHPSESSVVGAVVLDMLAETSKAGLAAASEALRSPEWTGLGLEWLRVALGKREWRVECMDLYIRL